MLTAIIVVAVALASFTAGVKYQATAYKAAYVIKADSIKEFDAAIGAVTKVRDAVRAEVKKAVEEVKSKV